MNEESKEWIRYEPPPPKKKYTWIDKIKKTNILSLSDKGMSLYLLVYTSLAVGIY